MAFTPEVYLIISQLKIEIKRPNTNFRIQYKDLIAYLFSLNMCIRHLLQQAPEWEREGDTMNSQQPCLQGLKEPQKSLNLGMLGKECSDAVARLVENHVGVLGPQPHVTLCSRDSLGTEWGVPLLRRWHEGISSPPDGFLWLSLAPMKHLAYWEHSGPSPNLQRGLWDPGSFSGILAPDTVSIWMSSHGN